MSGFDPGSNLIAGIMVDQDDSIDQQGSTITAAFLNGLQLEQNNLVTHFGGVPAFGVNNQLATLIDAYIASQVAAQTRAPNHFPDPCCRVANGPTALALSTSRQYGRVDLVQAWCSTGAVVGGTIIQDTAGNGGGRTQSSVKLAGVTLTGAGAALSWRRWIASQDAQDYVGGVAYIACTIKQTTGGALNMSFAVNKANASNNFGAVTNIGNSGNINCPSGVGTKVGFFINNMGACGNGIEVIPTLVTGPIGAQDIYITDFQISPVSVAATFEIPKYATDRQAVLPYFEQSYEDGTAAGTATTNGQVNNHLGAAIANGSVIVEMMDRFLAKKVVSPVCTAYSSSTGASGKINDQTVGADKASNTSADQATMNFNNSSGGALASGDLVRAQWTADARL